MPAPKKDEKKPDPKPEATTVDTAPAAPAHGSQPDESAAPSKPLTDNDVLVRNDEITLDPEANLTNDDAPSGGAPEAAGGATAASPVPGAPAAPAPEKKEWKLGKKTFGSAEELAAYVTGSAEAQEAAINATSAPAPANEPPPVKFEDVIYEDPAKAKQILLDEVRAELKLEDDKKLRAQQAEDRRKAHWQGFYNSNPDLVGFEDEVAVALNQVTREHGDNLPIAKALPLIAQAARTKIDKLKERLAPATELQDRQPTTHVGGAEVPRRQPAPQVVGFAEQVNRLRRREHRG